jgi:hypothetical protein
MSINAILAATSPQTKPAAQVAGQGSQSYADWYASLTGALGSSSTASTATTTGASSSQLSDNMQALLTQLQSGNTIAPSGAGSNPASTTGTTGAGHAHHHHHHGAGGSSSPDSTDGSVDQDSSGVLEDIAGSLTGSTTSGSSGSSSNSLFGTSTASASSSTGSGLMSGLQSLGSTALAGVRQALQAYAAMHGVQVAQTSATA